MIVLGLASVYAIARATGTPVPVRARLAWAAGSVGSVAALLWTHYLGFTLLPVMLVAAVQGAPAALARAPRIRRGALLAGSALAIGACQIGNLARKLEPVNSPEQDAKRKTLLSGLVQAVNEFDEMARQLFPS